MSNAPRFRLMTKYGTIYREEDGKIVEGWKKKGVQQTAEEYVADWNSRLSPDGSHNDASLLALDLRAARLISSIDFLNSTLCGSDNEEPLVCKPEVEVSSPDLANKWVISRDAGCAWNAQHKIWVDSVDDATHFNTKEEALYGFNGTEPNTMPEKLEKYLAEKTWSSRGNGGGLPVANTDSNASLDLS